MLTLALIVLLFTADADIPGCDSSGSAVAVVAAIFSRKVGAAVVGISVDIFDSAA